MISPLVRIFKSLVSIILIVIANQIAKRNGEERLF